ncbi:MAG: homoserine kinase [Candidatus Diapherotrites archaeon]|uniref:Homoserine kinase n=2 Tax=Candidatus Iainarchaeum sp. TaxID=3101447 RepID=A0A8T4L9V0_9ARCH|nr:homoserine kinase [Candidatus Diapherotrites archaeon]
MDDVKIFAPASVANVGPGFDVLGFALEGIGDIVKARRVTGKGVRLTHIHNDGGRLPLDPAKNTASVAAQQVLEKLGIRGEGIELELEKGLPLNSGLGSSGASAAAGAYAALKLFGNGQNKEEALEACVKAEGVASGFHADNVAPALLGGVVLIRSYTPLDFIRIPFSASVYVTLVKPDIEIRTRQAREALPRKVPLAGLVKNTGNVAALVSGFFLNDPATIGKAIDDCLIEPVRQKLIPGFREAKQAAIEAGCLGCSIAGSGPSVFALSESKKTAKAIGEAMRSAFTAKGLGATKIVSCISSFGARSM